MAKPSSRARVEGAPSPAVKANRGGNRVTRHDLAKNVEAYHGERFRAAVEAFKAAYPAEWAEIALCPTQHGLDIIAGKLEG